VQQRATDQFGSVSCNKPRQARANSEYQRFAEEPVELHFSAYQQVTVETFMRFPS
jgi:hypothetical protein